MDDRPQKSLTDHSRGFLGAFKFPKIDFHPADLMASAVVFIIAVPLSLGIASASGMPATSALVAAIVGGLVVGLLSGAPLVVSGPAAGLTSMVLGFTLTYGVQSIAKITIIAGFFQLIFGGLKLGRLIAKIPRSVLEGVLSAIGVTILLGQLHIMFGQTIPGGPIASFLGLKHSFSQALYGASSHPFPWSAALTCGVLGLGIQLAWPRLLPQLKWLPAALPATLLVTLAALGWSLPRVQLADLGPHIQGAIKNTMDGASFFGQMAHLWLPSLGLAIVASAESLLTARAIDVLATKRSLTQNTQLDRELVAQGTGNLISGALGGLPMTGVMVRSAANLAAGARSRWSTILHGLLVALAVVFFASILEKIPLAVLASILVLTGLKLLNLPSMLHELKQDPVQAWIWPMTLVSVLATDLLVGLGIGLAVAMVQSLFLKKYAKKIESGKIPAAEVNP